MRTQEQINAELEGLRQALSKVEGTPTEVYTRIVGYYRSLTNWNKGKREEYDYRKVFRAGDVPGAMLKHAEPKSTAAVPEQTVDGYSERAAAVRELPAASEAGEMDFYIFFYRNTCPNCPPVKNYIAKLPIKGRQVNVDEPEGLALAEEHQVLASPTVVFFDAHNNEKYRAHNVQSLKEIARFAGIKRELASV